MRRVFADFNARTEAGHVCLDCRGSQDDLRDQGIEIGDWMWLSDGELVLGAKLAIDDRYGPVGIPRWKTLVHLDDDDTQNVSDVRKQVLQLPDQAGHDLAIESRMFQLLTILEVIDPQGVKDTLPFGSIAFRRAAALFFLEELELALLVVRDALETWSDDPALGFLYMEILRRLDPDRANAEAGRRAEVDGADARVLAACIHIRSATADHTSDEDFADIGPRILEWVARFERAPGRDQVEEALLALVLFNEGMTLLRLGRFGEARVALGRARTVNPNESAIAEASQLQVYDDQAREIATRIHEMPLLVAA